MTHRCHYCHGLGIVSRGGWHFDGEPWDDIEDVDCPCCHGTGYAGPLWPLAWVWRQASGYVRVHTRWADDIPF